MFEFSVLFTVSPPNALGTCMAHSLFTFSWSQLMCSQMHPLSSPPPSSFSSSLTDLIVAWPGFSLIPAWGKGGGSLNLKGEGGDLSDEREKASLFQGVIIRLSHQMCDGPVLRSKRLFKCRRVHCQSRCDQIFLPAASFLQKWRNECYHQGSFYFSTGFMFDCVPACGTLCCTLNDVWR